MRDFKNLRVWHAAQDLEARLVELLPPARCRRAPGQRAQILNAVASVPANIAEGCAKSGPAERRRYLEIALGSLLEVESRVSSLQRIRILSEAEGHELSERIAVVRKMLISLINSTR